MNNFPSNSRIESHISRQYSNSSKYRSNNDKSRYISPLAGNVYDEELSKTGHDFYPVHLQVICYVFTLLSYGVMLYITNDYIMAVAPTFTMLLSTISGYFNIKGVTNTIGYWFFGCLCLVLMNIYIILCSMIIADLPVNVK